MQENIDLIAYLIYPFIELNDIGKFAAVFNIKDSLQLYDKFIQCVEYEEMVTYELMKECPHKRDGPAIIYKNGTEEWYLFGKLHRTDGPAIEYIDGSIEYWENGLLHRDIVGNSHSRNPGPAIEYRDGLREWWKNGNPIMEINPYTLYYHPQSSAIDDEDIISEMYDSDDGEIDDWEYGGLLHREGAPARTYWGDDKLREEYWKNGQLHRVDGPAIILYLDKGDRNTGPRVYKYIAYYVRGKLRCIEGATHFREIC